MIVSVPFESYQGGVVDHMQEAGAVVTRLEGLFLAAGEALFGKAAGDSEDKRAQLLDRRDLRIGDAVENLLEIRETLQKRTLFSDEALRERLCTQYGELYAQLKKANQGVDDLKVDRLILATILSPPLSKFYIAHDGTRYSQPNYQIVNDFCLSFFSNSLLYTQITLRIQDDTFYTGRICDVVYVEKTEVLKGYHQKVSRREVVKKSPCSCGTTFTGPWTYASLKTYQLWHRSDLNSLLLSREATVRDFAGKIQNQYRGWGYSQYELCDRKSLLNLGVAPSIANAYDVLLLFYERV